MVMTPERLLTFLVVHLEHEIHDDLEAFSSQLAAQVAARLARSPLKPMQKICVTREMEKTVDFHAIELVMRVMRKAPAAPAEKPASRLARLFASAPNSAPEAEIFND